MSSIDFPAVSVNFPCFSFFVRTSMELKSTPLADRTSLPDISIPKDHDLANPPHIPSQDEHDPDDTHQDSDSDTTATNSSDEFDWDEEDDAKSIVKTDIIKAKRGRALWMMFMKLARPVRVLIIGILGTGILIAPLFVSSHLCSPLTLLTTELCRWFIFAFNTALFEPKCTHGRCG